MAGTLLAIEWTDPESNGFIDLFRQEFFASAGTSKAVVHPVIGRRGGFYRAKCNISVKDNYADLDYGAFQSENTRWEMYLGVTRLIFSSLKREKIKRIQWKYDGKRVFQSGLARPVSNPLRNPGAYKLGTSSKKRGRRDVVERPGQARFKSNLMAIYDGKCCISGCSIEQALDGAHIDKYYGPTSDHPQNGLLLRRDLHALFDCDLLGIDPVTQTVHLRRDILHSQDYRKLNGRHLNPPHLGGKGYYPSVEALRRRWKCFNK